MNNYFRITAYHPTADLSIIVDSNGKFDALWKFSAALVQKGFKIIEVGKEMNFMVGNIPLTDMSPTDKYVLRTYANGKPIQTSMTIDGRRYAAVQVGDMAYVPDKTKFA